MNNVIQWSRLGARALMASLAAAVVSMIGGCASGPRPVATDPSGVIRPDRDGPPLRPPADLAQVPDAEPKVENILPRGPNKPYVVLGKSYEPLAEDVSFRQRGRASWYGTKFHGRRTASGEVYSMYGMTAAHRTLPIPSYARVREPRSGKEIIVRINDRGPFHSDRVIDLSYTAAVKLGIVARGSAEVEVERLTFEQIRTGQWRSGQTMASTDEPSAPVAPQPLLEDPILALAGQLEQANPVTPDTAAPPAPPPVRVDDARSRAYTPAAKGFWVQLAAFTQRSGVDAFQKRVAAEISHLSPLLAVFQEGPTFRLQAGPYGARHEAHAAAQRVREALQLSPMVVERR